MKKPLLTLTYALAFTILTFNLAVCAQAQTFSNVANFDMKDGFGPVGPLMQAANGNFYGATVNGGHYPHGNIFELTPAGKLRSMHDFCSQPNCADGEEPVWGPVLGSDGNLYGVAGSGGSNVVDSLGSGTFYKMTTGGAFTILYNFCPSAPCTDGQYPTGIVLGGDGNFYGTTFGGGKFNSGTIFRISPTGKIKVLYSFCSLKNCADGSEPSTPPILASDGSLYGVTARGVQVVYELTAAGSYKVIHTFCSQANCKDGDQPTSLVQGANGNILGTTVQGGKYNVGTVFEVTTADQYIVLDSLGYLRGTPFAGLALANDGNLYGVTVGPSGAENGGTVFEVTPTGRYTDLHTIAQCSITGYQPYTTLFQGTNGLLYGTTAYGGNDTEDGCAGDGTIFSVDNHFSPLVETVPTLGKVGKSVLILGNNLSGTTSVTFNGVPAEFKVEKDTFIRATVPASATTGIVSVVTPSGTLNSNPQFVVTK
jgi:uncharacterized repeat protein (TIGR03803 family)